MEYDNSWSYLSFTKYYSPFASAFMYNLQIKDYTIFQNLKESELRISACQLFLFLSHNIFISVFV